MTEDEPKKERKKLTKAQAGRLGGLARARVLAPERRSEIAFRAGWAGYERYGTEGMTRASHGLKYRRVDSNVDSDEASTNATGGKTAGEANMGRSARSRSGELSSA